MYNPYKPKDLLRSLTQRELENLKLISAGKTNKDIAKKLGITEATVKIHVKVYSKNQA